MLKRKIKYIDYNGVEREEDFYFNLTKADVAEMELTTVGGLEAMFDKISQTQDIPAVAKVLKGLIYKAYGEKSPDGKHFVRTPEVKEAFFDTEAYSELFTELVTDPVALNDFVRAILPKAPVAAEASAPVANAVAQPVLLPAN